MTYQIVDPLGTVHTATAVNVDNSSLVYATFDMTGLPTGTYAITVTDGGHSATLPAAFDVSSGSGGSSSDWESDGFECSMSAPSQIRAGRTAQVVIHYRNAGLGDARGRVLLLSGNGSFALPGEKTLSDGKIYLFAGAHEGPAGTLPPGYSGTITVLAKANSPSATSLDLQLSEVPPLVYVLPPREGHSKGPGSPESESLSQGEFSGDPTCPEWGACPLPIRWDDQYDDLRLPGLSEEGWSAIYKNFVAAVGPDTNTFTTAIDADATYLSQLGIYTTSLSDLLRFEMLKAGNFGAIQQQTRLGPLGYGMPDPNVTASTEPSGNVNVIQGSAVKSFTLQPDGSYICPRGDFSALDLIAGVYQIEEADGTLEVFNSNGTLNYVQLPNGDRITYSYAGGLLTGITDQFTGQTVTFTYNTDGRITEITDPQGRTTTLGYDSTGQYLLSIQNAAGTTTISYVDNPVLSHVWVGLDPIKTVGSITYPDGSQLNVTYDSHGRIATLAENGNANLVAYSYDQGTISQTDSLGNTVYSYLDQYNDVVKYVDPLGNVVTGVLNDNLQLTTLTLPGNLIYTANYDALGNAISVIDPLGSQTRATYTANSELTELTDPRGTTTNYVYDALSNLTNIVYPHGTSDRYDYDALSNVSVYTRPDSNAIHLTYNQHGFITSATLPDSTSYQFAYDGRDNLISATDATATMTFDYDTADRLVRVTYPSSNYVGYAYNSLGQRIQMQTLTGYTVNYRYDTLGRLAGLTDASDNLIVSYTYDVVGRLAGQQNGNGTSTSYSYDAAGNTTAIVNYGPDQLVQSYTNYTYDALGLPIAMATPAGTTTYGYDADGQLTSVSLPGGRIITYQYDATGNRIAVIDSGTATFYTTNNMNQYVVAGDAHYTYDLNGNLISRTDGTGTTAYSYNVLGQLTQVVTPTDGTTSYQYDALGNLASQIHNGETTHYLIDPTGLGNVLGQFDDTGNIIAQYTYGLGLVSQIGASGASGYYGFDLSGNTTQLSGAGGAILNTYSYLPFGEVRQSTGSMTNVFTFGGEFGVMEGAGLYYMRNRWYDMGSGHFTQRDPIGLAGGDANLYSYVGNSPVRFTDPVGLRTGGGVIQPPPLIRNQAPYIEPAVNLIDAIRERAEYAQRYSDAQRARRNSPKDEQTATTGVIVTNDAKSGRYLRHRRVNLNTLPVLGPGQVFVGDSPNARLAFVSGRPRPQPAFCAVHPTPTPRPNFEYRGPDLAPSPKLPTAVVDDAKSKYGRSLDPNDILGPSAYGAENFISASSVLPYTIVFENAPSAEAWAARVQITQQLDADLDWSTFELGDIQLGGLDLSIPAGLSSIHQTFDERSTLGVYVQVVAGINANTGLATWTLTALDPTTTDIPDDPLLGLLAPNISPPEGDGSVSYTIRPKASATTGAVINAQASIIFDVNAPIATSQIFNTIDAGGPASSVSDLPDLVPLASFTVGWAGQDDGDGTAGSGITGYDIYVSDNGGPYRLWFAGTTDTQATFQGLGNHTYTFYSVATDGVGHTEPLSAEADAYTTVEFTTDPRVASVAATSLPGASSGVRLDVVFTESMAIAPMIAGGSITAAVSLLGFQQSPVPLTADQFAYNDTTGTLTVSVPALTAGDYQLRLDGSQLLDAAGSPLRGGTDGTISFPLPVFDAAQNVQADGADIQVAAYSAPSLAEWNNDGLLDLIVGEQITVGTNRQGKVRVYLNQGTNTAPVFTTFSYAQAGGADLTIPATGCLGVFPRVFDWDGDGKKDLILGQADGRVQFWPNVNTDADPQFGTPSHVQVGAAGSKADINVGARATPDIVDWNDDGRPDLVVGGLDGRIHVFVNQATSGAPDFQTDSIVQAGSGDLVVPSGRSSAAVYDLDGDGRKDLVTGNTDGQLLFYPNIGSDLTPAFSTSQPLQAGGTAIDLPGTPRSRPFVGDFNGDGMPDILLGAQDGLVRLYVGHPGTPTGPTVGDPGEVYAYTVRLVPTGILVGTDHSGGSVYGQAVTFTATVSAFSGTPTGSVQFTIDGSPVGSTVPLAAGVADLVVSTLTAGGHEVSAAYTSDTPDYLDSQTASPLEAIVMPAPLTVIADGKSKVYGAALPALTASYSGWVNGDTPAVLTTPPTLSTTATAASHVGSYPITASGAVAVNYDMIYVDGMLTVTPAPLTITADDKSNAYWAPLPELTASYTGLVNGDTPASLDTPPALSTTATATSLVGTYPITAAGASDADYTVIHLAGTLTVTDSHWHNPSEPCDVTGDGQVLPVDVLHVITYINEHPGDASLPPPPASAPPFYDVNGDNLVTAVDALLVIAYINERSPKLAEGEAAGQPAAALSRSVRLEAGGRRPEPCVVVTERLSENGDRHPTSCASTHLHPQHPGASPRFRTASEITAASPSPAVRAAWAEDDRDGGDGLRRSMKFPKHPVELDLSELAAGELESVIEAIAHELATAWTK
jgi:RHS repeat-associated protein